MEGLYYVIKFMKREASSLVVLTAPSFFGPGFLLKGLFPPKQLYNVYHTSVVIQVPKMFYHTMRMILKTMISY